MASCRISFSRSTLFYLCVCVAVCASTGCRALGTLAEDGLRAAGRSGGKAVEEAGQATGRSLEEAAQAGKSGGRALENAERPGAGAAGGALNRASRDAEVPPLRIPGALTHPPVPAAAADDATDALRATTQSSVEDALSAADINVAPSSMRDASGAPVKIGDFEQLVSYRTYQALLPKLKAGARLRTIAIIPQTELAIRRTFGYVTQIGARQEDELRSYAKLFAEIDNTIVISKDNADSNAFVQSLQDGPPGPVVIVGHSEEGEDGRMLMLPNGEGIAVERIHQECWRAGRLCVVVTCNGEDVRLGTVRLGEALVMTEVAQRTLGKLTDNASSVPAQMRQALQRGDLTEYDVMVYSMREAVVNRRLLTRMVYASAGTGVLAGTAVLYSEEYGGPA